MIREQYDVYATLFHAFSWDGPDALYEVDIDPTGGGCLCWAGHGVELPLDQAAGCPFNAGIGYRHHEFFQLIEGQCRHVLLFRLLEDGAYSAEWICVDQS